MLIQIEDVIHEASRRVFGSWHEECDDFRGRIEGEIHAGAEELLLGVEVVGDQCRITARATGNRAHRRVVVASGDKLAARGFDDAFFYFSAGSGGTSMDF